MLFLYRDGALRSILSVSSGNGERFCEPDPEQGGKIVCDVANTPGGSFRVYNRILGFRESRLGALYNPLYFNGGIAVHGSKSVPAGPASHGCVRVTMASAEWLFDYVPNGMPVYVYDGERVPRPLPDRTATTTTTTTTVAGAPGATTIPGTVTSPTSTVPGTASTVPGTVTTSSSVPTSTSSVPGESTTTTSTTTTTTTTTSTTTTTLPPVLPAG